MLARTLISTLVFVILVSAGGMADASARKEINNRQLKSLVAQLSANPPADCSGPIHNSQAAVELEDQLFNLLGHAVLDALNSGPPSPGEIARITLAQLKTASDRITKSWESDMRLRYQIFSFQPLIVIELGIWNQDSFVAYAPADHALNPRIRWMIVHSEDEGGHQIFEHLRLSPLWRGPSGNSRFLAIKHFSGCMAGMTIDYLVQGYEWRPGDLSLTTILTKESSFSDERPKWKLDTSGKIVAIPYCWSGGLELGGVSATVCSLDTYDLSGNMVRFVHTENDPEDLAVVARAMEYSGGHNINALNALCKSPQVARHLMEMLSPNNYFVGFERKRLGSNEEMLDFEDGMNMKFTLKKQRGQWKIVAFTLKQNR